jgi:hypothetical protein
MGMAVDTGGMHLVVMEMQKIKKLGNFGPYKPPYSYICLITMAILESEQKMCTLSEVCKAYKLPGAY